MNNRRFGDTKFGVVGDEKRAYTCLIATTTHGNAYFVVAAFLASMKLYSLFGHVLRCILRGVGKRLRR